MPSSFAPDVSKQMRVVNEIEYETAVAPMHHETAAVPMEDQLSYGNDSSSANDSLPSSTNSVNGAFSTFRSGSSTQHLVATPRTTPKGTINKRPAVSFIDAEDVNMYNPQVTNITVAFISKNLAHLLVANLQYVKCVLLMNLALCEFIHHCEIQIHVNPHRSSRNLSRNTSFSLCLVLWRKRSLLTSLLLLSWYLTFLLVSRNCWNWSPFLSTRKSCVHVVYVSLDFCFNFQGIPVNPHLRNMPIPIGDDDKPGITLYYWWSYAWHWLAKTEQVPVKCEHYRSLNTFYGLGASFFLSVFRRTANDRLG